MKANRQEKSSIYVSVDAALYNLAHFKLALLADHQCTAGGMLTRVQQSVAQYPHHD